MPAIRHAVRGFERRFGRKPKFVVAGTGRCGTTYVAKVLQEAGVRCGHEKLLTPTGNYRSLRYTGDCSYLVVPFLPEFEGKVIHLVRNPVHVVRSFVGVEFFKRDDYWIWPVLPYIKRDDDPAVEAMRYYVAWNEMIEPYADLRVRIEDFDQGMPQVLDLVAPKAARHHDLANSAVPTDTNTKKRAEHLAELGDLPAGPDRDALVAIGQRYGYDLSS